jgi:hypothetical protein
VAASSGAFLWVVAGTLLGLTTATVAGKIRARHRLPASMALAPYADAGVQVSVPNSAGLAGSEVALKGFADRGVQALQHTGSLVLGET